MRGNECLCGFGRVENSFLGEHHCDRMPIEDVPRPRDFAEAIVVADNGGKRFLNHRRVDISCLHRLWGYFRLRGDLLDAMARLAEERTFDHIVIESTGILREVIDMPL